MKRHDRVAYSWIMDRFTTIRNLKRQVSVMLTPTEPQRILQLPCRMAEMDRWLDDLDRALDVSADSWLGKRLLAAMITARNAGDSPNQAGKMSRSFH